MNQLSLSAAQKLRSNFLPHIPPKASPIGSSVKLSLQAPQKSDPIALITDTRRGQTWRVALSREKDQDWSAEIKLPTEPTVLSYRFVLKDGRLIRERRQFEGIMETMLGGDWRDKDYRIAVYEPGSLPPAWTRGAVMYQIFPDRFAAGNPQNKFNKKDGAHGNEPLYPNWDEKPEHPPKSRDFFGGDLEGITNNLDKLADLGVTCLYLTPIFESPSNHRYDAIDYMKIDARLGKLQDFENLVAQASQRGIRVLLDGVFNHCSNESIYFKAALADKTSPWFRCFEFADWKRAYPPQPLPDAPWSHMMEYPLWPYYHGWADVKTMPEWVECPEMEDFFFGKEGVAPYWMSKGVAGWRTDVSPWLTEEFWKRFRKATRRFDPDAFIIAEDWSDSTPRFLGDTFDATMNYRFGFSVLGFVSGKLSASELDDRLETIKRDYPEPYLHSQLNLLGSHDTARVLSVFNGDVARLKLAVTLQLGYPGVPMIYYGDEAGCTGTYAEGGRAPYPWGKENPELMTFYRAAIHARRASKALSFGDVESAVIEDEHGLYGVWRTHQTERVLVLLNAGDEARMVKIPMNAPVRRLQTLLGNPVCLPSAQTLSVEIPACSAAWVLCEM